MISVIVPTLNEGATLARLLRDLAAEAEPHEVIVVDGGSGDGTPARARGLGARVIAAPRGRGSQLAAGAAAARGEVLFFLHADSRLGAGALTAIARTLATRPAAPGGNFRLIFDGQDRFSRGLTCFYAWLRRRGRYYGDSGVFVRSEVYWQLGGVRPIALMEDYDFIRRLEAAGPTCCIDQPPLITSSRRFLDRHPLAIVGGWVMVHALFHLGVKPERLARLYYGRRRRDWGPTGPASAVDRSDRG